MTGTNMAKEIIRVVDEKIRSQQNVKIIRQTSSDVITKRLTTLIQWFKGPFPSTAKPDDCRYDPTDPTIADGLTVSANITLTWASPSHINASGALTITLPTGVKTITGTTDHSGIVMFCIRNSGTNIVTVVGSSLTTYLYPGEVVTVRTGITSSWEVVG